MKFETNCCICGCAVDGIGKNPWPVVKRKSAVCCNWCDSTIVWVARLRKFTNEDNEREL